MKNLVVVESPTKTKTLKKYLGKDFEIKASLGHIKDLPKSKLGVDVEHNFAPQYEVAPKKKKVVSELKAAAKKADQVYLATDPDREGEAIAQHVYEVISAKTKSQKSKPSSKLKAGVKRVVFHEITEDAVKAAFASPREVDADLVDAQKARRVLDRLVGYKLSPLLWKKIRYGLSAGRVQSVAVRLIVEREREREAFKPEEYWKIEAELAKQNVVALSHSAKKREAAYDAATTKNKFSALLIKKEDRKLEIKNKKQTDAILKDLKSANYIVKEIKTEEKKRYPAPPFMTSTLQQTAFNTFGFSSKRTMRAAQALYEQGLITYHRTDSTNLASSAISQIRSLIAKEFGDQYLPAGAKVYKTKAKVAQEAHEAIRVTRVGVKNAGAGDMTRLYDLIWKRTVACQMNPAIFDQQTVDISARNYLFRAVGSVLKFDGFLRVAAPSYGANERAAQGAATTNVALPNLSEGDDLDLVKLTSSQHFTQPPARYTEATLIKELEKNGIGRPSTYAPTISTIQERGYVSKEERSLKPEDIGIVVNDLLVEHFPEIVDLKFTAEMEDDLDKIADGKRKWVPVIKEFYGPFEKRLETKTAELKREDFTTLEKTREKCPECGKPLVVKLGKYGKFLSCSGFPECRYGRPYEDKDKDGEPDKADKSQLKGKCPECGGELQLKEGRFGKFIACGNYPKCKFTKTYLDKIGMKCPECKEGEVVVKKTKRGKVFYGCSNYPKCKWASWKDPRKSPRRGKE